MNYKTYFKEKLGKMLFLEMNKEGLLKALDAANTKLNNQELYLPISPDYLAKNIEKENKVKNLPIYEFVEGMFIALGTDKDLKYNMDYIILLKKIKDSVPFIKTRIAEKIKEKKYDDAYIMLKGLSEIDTTGEVLSRLLSLGEAIRGTDKDFEEVLKEDIKRYKDIDGKSPVPYLYEALILRDGKKFKKAYGKLNEYFDMGGEKSPEIIEIYQRIEDVVNFEEGKELVENKPEEALLKLIPLSERFGDDPSMFYYIALCYRKLNNFEKAVYYLNESLALDSSIVETVNEMGINLASVGDFESAVKYFRKAFEATRDVEICTNLIMCYLNIGDMKQAKLHLEMAEKINSEDEIVRQLREYIEK
ncbi:MAG: hypothetical protein ABRQ27_10610 [Clostridiaceae bacterium]